MAKIPGGINLAKNPSFTYNTTGWGGNAVGGTAGIITLDRVNNWSYVGKFAYYGKTQASAGVWNRSYAQLSTTSIPGEYTVNIPAGTPFISVSIKMQANNPASTGGLTRLGVIFCSATGTVLGQEFQIPGPYVNNTPQTLKFEGLAVPANTIYCYVVIYLYGTTTTNLPANAEIWVDGLQINPGTTVENYIDGDQGEYYGWSGAEGLSTSYRLEQDELGSTGSGGVITLDSRVFLADRHNNLIEDVTEHVLNGTVSMDIDRDGPKTTLQIQVSDPTIISTHAWLAVFYGIDKETEGVVESQIGLFRVEQPSETYSGSSAVTYGGYDPSILLADAISPDTLLYAGKYITAIESICNFLNVSHSFIADNRSIPAGGISFPPGVSYMKIVNTLLAAIGYYSVFTNHQGILTSFPIIQNLYAVEPSRTYHIGEGSELVDQISFDPGDDAIFNHVVVYRDDPAKGTAIVANRYFTDPNSPISTVNLGLKSKAIPVQEAADQAAINARAAKEIQDRTMYVSGNLEILPDPWLDMHSVIDLQLEETEDIPGASRRSGRYYINNLSYPLGSSAGTMKLGIRRVERTDV